MFLFPIIPFVAISTLGLLSSVSKIFIDRHVKEWEKRTIEVHFHLVDLTESINDANIFTIPSLSSIKEFDKSASSKSYFLPIVEEFCDQIVPSDYKISCVGAITKEILRQKSIKRAILNKFSRKDITLSSSGHVVVDLKFHVDKMDEISVDVISNPDTFENEESVTSQDIKDSVQSSIEEGKDLDNLNVTINLEINDISYDFEYLKGVDDVDPLNTASILANNFCREKGKTLGVISIEVLSSNDQMRIEEALIVNCIDPLRNELENRIIEKKQLQEL